MLPLFLAVFTAALIAFVVALVISSYEILRGRRTGPWTISVFALRAAM